MKPSAATPSKSSSAAPEAGAPEPRRRGGWVILLLGLALAGWIGVRVNAAMTGRKAVEREHAAVAKAAAETASRPPTVKVVRATRASWQPQVTFEGTLAPAHEADVGFKSAGRVAAIHVKVGDRVRAGTVLASLDAREAQAQVAAAEAQQQAAEAQLALAQDAERRTTAIVNSGAQAEATGVEAKQRRALCDAQLAAARAQLALARANLANQSLTAPFDGTIARSLSGAGGIVAPGMPGAPQFHLADLSSLKLVGTVGETEAALVKVGAEVELQRDGARTVRGKVTAVVAQLDPATKRVPVEAVIANDKDEPLFAGALVRASIRGAHAVDVLALPHEALRPGSQDEVMVVKGDRLAARRIDFVIARDGSLLVRRGLDARDDVLAAPWAEAKDGDPIAMASKEAAPGAQPNRGAP
jgi:RND family efflux transporter MFP subunit